MRILSFFRLQYRYEQPSDQQRAQGLWWTCLVAAIAPTAGLVLQVVTSIAPRLLETGALTLIPDDLPPIIACTPGVVGLIAALILLNRGKLAAASVVFVSTAGYVATLSYINSATADAMILVLSIPLVAAGVLFGRRGLLITGGALILLLLAHAGLAETPVLRDVATGHLTIMETMIYCSVFLAVDGLLLAVFTGGQRQVLQGNQALSRDLEAKNSQLQAAQSLLEEQNSALREAVQQYLQHMAAVGRGNLTVRLPVSDPGPEPGDPLVALAHRLNESTASLQTMARQVREVATSLEATSTGMLAVATEQAAGSTEQAAAITQTSTTIDEVRAIAEQMVQRAQAVAGIAQRTAQVSRRGQQAVSETVAGMQTVKGKVDAIAHTILALSEQAQAIGQIISAVSEIAAQSNMLALNAAVEAARAGEAGRGFAVVAGEVRVLAEQSRAATTQVKDILGEIQRGVNTAVMATEEGLKGAEVGTRMAEESGGAMGEVAASADESAQAAQQIAAAAGQQLTGMEQISQAMHNMHLAAARTVAGTRQSEQAAMGLNALSVRLREAIGQYQL